MSNNTNDIALARILNAINDRGPLWDKYVIELVEDLMTPAELLELLKFEWREDLYCCRRVTLMGGTVIREWDIH